MSDRLSADDEEDFDDADESDDSSGESYFVFFDFLAFGFLSGCFPLYLERLAS